MICDLVDYGRQINNYDNSLLLTVSKINIITVHMYVIHFPFSFLFNTTQKKDRYIYICIHFNLNISIFLHLFFPFEFYFWVQITNCIIQHFKLCIHVRISFRRKTDNIKSVILSRGFPYS